MLAVKSAGRTAPLLLSTTYVDFRVFPSIGSELTVVFLEHPYHLAEKLQER